MQPNEYNKAVATYTKLKTFVTNLKKCLDNAQQSIWDRITFDMPQFITIQDLAKPEQNIKPNIPTYTTTQEIINHVFKNNKVTINADGNKESILPQIFYYNNKVKFGNADLMIEPKELKESEFFQALLRVIRKKTEKSLEESYNKINKTPGYLTKTQESLNDHIAEYLTAKFNKLYCKNDENGYRFDLKLDKTEISLSIFKDNEVLILEDQSEGFKWFFNLFFHLLHGGNLSVGDIVIMDEPAHNLSVIARKEWRDFIKELEEKTGVTFVIVTHDPFLLNIDHFDELRIIQNNTEGNNPKGAMIINDFSSINANDTDALDKIKRAFGVGSHIFYDSNVRIILVEGATDYYYLTTFKILKEEEMQKAAKEKGEAFTPLNLAFLPIGGLGKKGDEKTIIEKIMKAHKDPILLTDADKAGEAIAKALQEIQKETNNQKLGIIHITLNHKDLGEIHSKFKNFKVIEDLFHEKDKAKYGLKEKHTKIARAFKKHLLWGKGDESTKIENETKENFYNLLEFLQKDL